MTKTESAAIGKSSAKLPPSIRRNCAASAPQWWAISRRVACQTARSFAASAVGPGIRWWSLRSFTKRKMKTQQEAPMAEMLIRYWMFPYHAASSSAPPPPSKESGECGGEREWFIVNREKFYGQILGFIR